MSTRDILLGMGLSPLERFSLVCNAIKERNARSFPQSCKAQKCWMRQRNTRLSWLKGRWKLIHLSNSTLRPKNSSSLRTTLFMECSLSVPSVPGNFQSADRSAEDCKVAESGRWQGKGQPGDPLTAQVSVTLSQKRNPAFSPLKFTPHLSQGQSDRQPLLTETRNSLSVKALDPATTFQRFLFYQLSSSAKHTNTSNKKRWLSGQCPLLHLPWSRSHSMHLRELS